jgi:hypothetical protein
MATLTPHRRRTRGDVRFRIRASWNRAVFRTARWALHRLTVISPAGKRYDLDHVLHELDALIDFWSPR